MEFAFITVALPDPGTISKGTKAQSWQIQGSLVPYNKTKTLLITLTTKDPTWMPSKLYHCTTHVDVDRFWIQDPIWNSTTYRTNTGAARKKERALILFRGNDLRIQDNKTIQQAYEQGLELAFLIVLDSRVVSPNQMPMSQARFLCESVSDLHQQLSKAYNAKLVIRFGMTEDHVLSVCKQLGIKTILTSSIMYDEAETSKRVLAGLNDTARRSALDIHHIGVSALVKSDVALTVLKGSFLQASQKSIPVASIVDLWDADLQPGLRVFQGEIHSEPMPNLQMLGYEPDGKPPILPTGGEIHALAALNQASSSLSKDLSPRCACDFHSWLRFGCVSPQRLYRMVGSERLHKELLWYEYCRVKQQPTNRAFRQVSALP